MGEELDFSNIDGMDDIDWSDVESELQQNREMILDEAAPADATASADVADTGQLDMAAAPPQAEGILASADDAGIDFLLDVPLQLTIEVGKTKLRIKDLLAIDIESVIELDKALGSPLNVLINDKLVAQGEVVVQNEKFALKITEILDEKERLKKLRMP